MKTKYNFICLGLCLFFLIISNIDLRAQSLDVSGESRTRGYFSHGIGMIPPKNIDAATFIEQRTRLNFDFKRNKLQFYLGLEDTRLWGQEGNPSLDMDMNLGVYQAFVNYQFANKFSVQFGRQLIDYNNERLFTKGNWTDWGNSFDMAVFHYFNKNDNVKIDIGMGASASDETAYNTIFEKDVAKYLGYMYYDNFFFDKKLELAVFSIFNGLQGGEKKDNKIITTDAKTIYANALVGPYVRFNEGNLQLEGEFYYEFGKTQTGRDLSATFYAFSASYNVVDSLIFTLGYERNSGTDWSRNDSKDRSTAFRNYYGEGNEYLGYLCYFVDGASTNEAGVQDAYCDIQYSPLPKFWVNPVLHFFFTAQDYLKPGLKVKR
ncbi:MAG: hypothetical protein ACEPOW_09960, partial [Bacteroidales bacterium]